MLIAAIIKNTIGEKNVPSLSATAGDLETCDLTIPIPIKEQNRPRIRFINQRNYVRHRSQYQKIRRERYIKDKDKEILRAKQYYEKNKEKIDAKRKQKFTCLCGCQVTRANKKDHLKTTKHKLGVEINFNKNLLFTKKKILNYN